MGCNSIYRWAVSQKLPVNGFMWVEKTSHFNEDFIKSNNEESDEGYFLEVYIQYPEKLHAFTMIYPFCLTKWKFKKVKKLATNLYDKKEYAMHIKRLKQAINHELVLKEVHRVVKFNQKLWLKPYIDMNTELIKNVKNKFEKYFFKLMNNAVFKKAMENIRKH